MEADITEVFFYFVLRIRQRITVTEVWFYLICSMMSTADI